MFSDLSNYCFKFSSGTGGDFIMMTCSVSNGDNRGLYVKQSSYSVHNSYVQESNFTQTKRPLHIISQKVNITFNRFCDNVCGPSDDDCITVLANAYESLHFHGKIQA